MNLFKHLATTILCIVGLCLISSTGYGETFYVDHARPDDNGDGKSWKNAKQTIVAGMSVLPSGGTLRIKSGSYNEPMIIEPVKPFDLETTIETDDGAGNPGKVIVTGSVDIPDDERVFASTIYIHNGGLVTLDGRQSIREGQSTYGFLLSPSENSTGIYVNESSANGRIRILRTEVEGVKPGEDAGSIEVAYAGYVEIGYCYLHQSGGYDGDVILVNSDPSVATTSGSIHHNEVTGNPSEGYGGITLKRTNAIQVYNNYIYGLPASRNGIINRDTSLIGSDGGDIFNNVIYDSGVRMNSAIQIRGESRGFDGTDNCNVFNNTIIMDTTPASIFLINDPSDGNKFYNNMIIADQVSVFVDSWHQNQGRNNSLTDNHVTGSVSDWFHSSGCGNMFSSSSPNYVNLGSNVVLKNGAKPSPFYHLTTDIQGISIEIDYDYDGNVRDNSPTVGAFEYGEPGAEILGAPKNLRIISGDS